MNDFDKLTAALGAIPGRIDDSGVMVIGEGYGGYVDLASLTALPEAHAVTFANGGGVNLRNLTALPGTHSVMFSNGAWVNLRNLTALPESHPVTFSNRGTVNLGSLTALPKTHPVTFGNRGWVYLRSLTQESQPYGGKSVRLRQIDGHTMLMGRSRKQGDMTIHSARYFGGGPIDRLRKCFIAQQGEYTAHGKTIASAVSDLRFKIAQVNFKADDLVVTIIERGTVMREDFRLITGACDDGLRHGLEQSGLPGDATELSLDVVMTALHGPYGDAFRDAI